MRLWVVAREGDHVVTDYTSYGSHIGYVAVERAALGLVVDWRGLDASLRAEAIELEVRDDISVAELTGLALDAARRSGRVRADGKTWLADAASNATYEPTLSLRDAEIVDGDFVVLNVEHPPEGMYDLLPAPNGQALLSMLDLAVHNPHLGSHARLWGALLYTSEDAALATYVRTHYQDLNTLTGPTFGIFAIEKPTDWRRAREYWARHLEEPLLRIFSTLRWLRWIPYDRSECYEIARVLNVPTDQLPCLVLIDDLNPSITFPIPRDADYPRFFRTMFAKLTEVAGEVPGNPAKELDDILRSWTGAADADDSVSDKLAELPGTPRALRKAIEDARVEVRMWSDNDPAKLDRRVAALRLRSVVAGTKVRLARDRILGALGASGNRYNFQGYTVFVNAGGDKVSEQFNFYGTTNFVNRPVNTIIQDFQKSYPSETASNAELSEMLRLILSSEELPQAKKEEAAVIVHEVAGELVAGRGGPKARGGLEKLKKVVGQAADIATPIVNLTTKLLELWQ